MHQKNNIMKLSILVPVFNEIKCIEIFTKKLFFCFQKEQPQFIFIDDGSNDGTKEWLTKNLIPLRLSGTIKFINCSKFDVSWGFYTLTSRIIRLHTDEMKMYLRNKSANLRAKQSNY